MPIVLVNAQIFFAGYSLSGQLNQVTLEYAAEALDATVFGNESRVRKGGLRTSQATGRGFWQGGTGNIDAILFDSLDLNDAVAMLFPETITEGATSTGSGFMFKVTESRFTVGGAVGELVPVDFTLLGRGIGA